MIQLWLLYGTHIVNTREAQQTAYLVRLGGGTKWAGVSD